MKLFLASHNIRRRIAQGGFILSLAVLVGCGGSGGSSSDTASSFQGTWVENTDGSPGIKVVIKEASLTVSGPGEDELFSGFIKGRPFSENIDYSITKNQDGHDVIEVMVKGRDCTLQPLSDSMDFKCFSGTELFLKRAAK